MMTSVIETWLSEHRKDYEELLAEKNIVTKHDGNLALFTYDLNLAIDKSEEIDFTNPIVKMCRGIIVDTNTMKVVCYPFDKFGNYKESYADDIDWSTARIQEKIDGSLVKLYYYDGLWRWATNGMINTYVTFCDNKSFGELIESATNYKNIDFDCLDKGCTYMFELTSPYNKVVIDYNVTSLWHIGTRITSTGQEINVDIGIKKPKEYSLKTLDDCLEAVEKLNTNEDVCEHEGFVVVDANFHRVKIKSMAYVTVHRMVSDRKLTPRRILDIYKQNIVEQFKDFPREYMMLKRFEFKVSCFRNTLYDYITRCLCIYEEYDKSRKSLANHIKDDPLKSFAFGYLDCGDMSVVDYIDNKLDYLADNQPVNLLKLIENEI